MYDDISHLFIITLYDKDKKVLWLNLKYLTLIIAFQIMDNPFMIKTYKLHHILEYVNQHKSVFINIHKIIVGVVLVGIVKFGNKLIPIHRIKKSSQHCRCKNHVNLNYPCNNSFQTFIFTRCLKTNVNEIHKVHYY